MGVISCGTTMLDQGEFENLPVVNWDTTPKTTAFTAVSGNGYFVNTTSGAITVTLPASPSAGNIVAVSDYAGTANTNNITIARNGSNIEGGTENSRLVTNREARTFVYVDGTQGWVPVSNNDSSGIPPVFLTATGGTETTCGDFKIHTFTGPGTFCVSEVSDIADDNIVSYIVVAGGGGGRDDGGAAQGGGGGGGGGFRENKSPVDTYSESPLEGATDIPVSVQGYPIVVGAGGARQSNPGANSVFSTITSTGGGGGGTYNNQPGQPGGSGGGGGASSAGGGGGNTPPTSPPQGRPGSSGSGPHTPGAGGGAGQAGSGRNGGNGVGTLINPVSGEPSGCTQYYAGGGASGQPPAVGGLGGGGPRQVAGDANTGGGGGGGNGPGTSKAGGSGIVVIRYKFQ